MNRYKVVNRQTGKVHKITASNTKNLGKVILPRYHGQIRLCGDSPITVYFDALFDTDKYAYECYKLSTPKNRVLDVNETRAMLDRIERAARVLGTDEYEWTIRMIAMSWFDWNIPEVEVVTMAETLRTETIY